MVIFNQLINEYSQLIVGNEVQNTEWDGELIIRTTYKLYKLNYMNESQNQQWEFLLYFSKYFFKHFSDQL